MKRTLITLLTLAGCSTVAQGAMTAPLTITFGDNSADSTGSISQQEEQLNSETVTYNKISTDMNSGVEVDATALKLTDATISPIGITLNNPVSGAGGQINSLATGVNSVVSTYFTADMLGGAVNAPDSASITLTGLTQGNYVLYALGARGNNYAGNTNRTTYTLTAGEGTTVSNVKASILDYAVASGVTAPTLDAANASVTGATYGGNNQATNWVLMSFSFDVLSGGAVTLTGDGNSGNIAALTLVPEPGSAVLSLLALAGLAGRRRRR